MTAIKPMGQISEKWQRVAQVSQPEYEAGVRNPKADWATETAKAEGNWIKAITQAANDKRFGSGVRKAGTSKWQKNTLEKGPGRWAEGIRVSTDAYEKGFAPFRQVIESLTLPARGPKGDPANINRVAVVAKALHDAKVKGGTR